MSGAAGVVQFADGRAGGRGARGARTRIIIIVSIAETVGIIGDSAPPVNPAWGGIRIKGLRRKERAGRPGSIVLIVLWGGRLIGRHERNTKLTW